MAVTPTFVPQDNTNYTAIRYFTDSDPYYYSVDNRPLTDIETNIVNLRQYGADGARRGVMIEALSGALERLEYGSIPSGYTYRAIGFTASQPLAGQVTVAAGAIIFSENVSVGTAYPVPKIAAFLVPQTFAIPAPGTVGQSIVYTIEGTLTDLTTGNMATSNLPYMDANNTFLPSTIMGKELKLSLLTGTAATTGTEVPAATTSGKFPLYNITVVNGSTTFRVWAHTNSPYFKGINETAHFEALTANAGSYTQSNDLPIFTFADSVTSGVILRVPVEKLNPFKNLTLQLTFSPTVTGSAIVMRTRSVAIASGVALAASYVNGANEAITITAGANNIQTYTLATSVVANTQFAAVVGGVGGTWGTNVTHLGVVLERIGADGADTNAGTLRLLHAVLLQ